MIFEGKAIQVSVDANGIAELCFDQKSASVNKFDQTTLSEFREAIGIIASSDEIKAVLVTSGKPVFIVGADITELHLNFDLPHEQIKQQMLKVNHEIFNAFEDLPLPTVVCISGLALGGGLEMALTADYRVMSTKAKVGLPEVSLGIIPGWGGTVRLPRVIGADNAIEWITTGKHYRAQDAFRAGVVDAIVEPQAVKAAGLTMVQQCLDGKLDYRAKRQEKLEPLKLNDIEATMAFSMAKGMVAGKAGPHFPAPLTVVKTLEAAAGCGRDGALECEAEANAKLVRGPVAKHLIGLFNGDQALMKTGKTWAKAATPANKVGVLGAGIMGGGIAYQTAVSGLSALMKDIDQKGIDLGLAEASKLLSKQLKRGKIKPEQMAQTLTRIQPTLTLNEFDTTEVVIEAVVENAEVKKAVLAETEAVLKDDAVLTSNTSTISITELASALKAPERFCGMHFFNPVHQMPLVEIIRGEKTSDSTVAQVVSLALAMGKKPVVVNDCAGFLVNRVLSTYLLGFIKLVKLGVDYTRIDKVMESFGWPMGPAYLSDVIGIDTLKHGEKALSAGFPERQTPGFTSSHDLLLAAGRLGQKSGSGYYRYELDKRGRSKKVVDEEAMAMAASIVEGDAPEFSDDDIVAMLMLPMCFECVLCLQDDIAASATDIDMALIYGIAFPSFRGGALRYLDAIGIDAAISLSEKYSAYGVLYEAPAMLREMADSKSSFYPY